MTNCEPTVLHGRVGQWKGHGYYDDQVDQRPRKPRRGPDPWAREGTNGTKLPCQALNELLGVRRPLHPDALREGVVQTLGPVPTTRSTSNRDIVIKVLLRLYFLQTLSPLYQSSNGVCIASKEMTMCCSVPRVSLIEDTLRDATSVKSAEERQARHGAVPNDDRKAPVSQPSGKEKAAPHGDEAVSCDC